jgi:hypothetical protein
MPELNLPIRCRGVLVKFLVRPRTGPAMSLRTVGPLTAYLDTGASDSMLELGILQSLDLVPTHSTALNILGQEQVSFHDLFEVEVAVVTPNEQLRWVPLIVLGGAVFQTGAVAALGRDFLRHVVFTYNGPQQQVKLSW